MPPVPAPDPARAPSRAPSAVPSPDPDATPPVHRIVGILLTLPAVALWLVGLVVPSLSTVLMSFQQVNAFGAGSGFIGLANYSHWLQTSPIGTVITMAVLAFAAGVPGVVFGVLIGTLASRGSSLARGLVAAALGLLAVCWAPVGVTLSLWFPLDPERGRPLVEQPQISVALTTAVIVLPVVTAASGAVSLLIGRGHREGRVRIVVAAAAAGLLAGIAAAAQTFAVPQALTHGGPRNETMTTLLGVWQSGFVRGDFGMAAAGSTLLGLGLGVLGVVAGVALLLTRVRLEVRAPASAPGGLSFLGWFGLVLAAAAVGAVAFTHRAWLASFAVPGPDGASPLVVLWTWGPSALVVVLQVLVAALAGYGIGALRPVGRASEWLLLPFLPWLFVGDGPLVIAHYLTARSLGGLNVPWYAPTWVSVPLLVVATLVAGAISRHRSLSSSADRISVRDLVLGTMGAAIAVGTLAWIARANALMWPLSAITKVDLANGPVALLLTSSQNSYTRANDLWLTVGTPAALFVLQLALVAAGSWLALNRFALVRLGRAADPAARPPAGTGPR